MEEINKSIKELERFINEKGYVEYGIENACGELDIVFYKKRNGDVASLCRPTELVTIHAIRALKTLRAVKLIKEDKEDIIDGIIEETFNKREHQQATYPFGHELEATKDAVKEAYNKGKEVSCKLRKELNFETINDNGKDSPYIVNYRLAQEALSSLEKRIKESEILEKAIQLSTVSTCHLGLAYKLLSISKDYDRDVVLIKNGFNKGLSEEYMASLIELLNK